MSYSPGLLRYQSNNRHEPTVVKHRPKPFPRMRQPRAVLKAKIAA